MNSIETREIQCFNKLNECRKILIEKGYKPIAIMLYGSDNYNLALPTSDFDFKAIVVPTLDDIVFNRKPVSTVVELPVGQVDVKNISLMFNCFLKQNINFVELLFTKYRWVAPEYEEMLKPLFDNREAIARYDEEKAMSCIRGMAKEKYVALFKPYPSQKEVVETYGYAAKQLHHMYRLVLMSIRYKDRKMSYEEILHFETGSAYHTVLMNIKTYNANFLKSLNDVDRIGKSALETLEKIKNSFVPRPINHEIETLLNSIKSNIIRYSLKRELSN